MKKRIIVIDDEPLISTLMKEIVEEDPELEVAQITTKKNEFLEAISQSSFDVALMDISVGEREGGVSLLKLLKEKSIVLPVIMLSAHDENLYALRCLKAGAKGYISKEYICDQLIHGLKAVIDGHLFVSGEKGNEIVQEYKDLAH